MVQDPRIPTPSPSSAHDRPSAAKRVPATGENLCTACEGIGAVNGRTCALCGGTGHLPVPSGGV